MHSGNTRQALLRQQSCSIELQTESRIVRQRCCVLCP